MILKLGNTSPEMTVGFHQFYSFYRHKCHSLCIYTYFPSLCLDHVARIIELLGRIPPQIAFSWKKSTKFFSRPGKNRSKEVYCESLKYSYSSHTENPKIYITQGRLQAGTGRKRRFHTEQQHSLPCLPSQSRSIPGMNAKS